MRVFTALFYFLFFSLTAWGQTGRPHDSNYAKPKRCAECIHHVLKADQFNFGLVAAVASSLKALSNNTR